MNGAWKEKSAIHNQDNRPNVCGDTAASRLPTTVLLTAAMGKWPKPVCLYCVSSTAAINGFVISSNRTRGDPG